MKNYQTIVLSASLLLSAVSPLSALAVSGSPSQNQNQNQYQNQIQGESNQPDSTVTPLQYRQQTQEQVQVNSATPTQDRPSFMNQLKLKLVQTIQNRIRQRLENQFQRLSQVQVTLEAKINQRKQAGLDTSAVDSEVAKTSPIKEAYQKFLAGFDDVVNQMNQSQEPVKFRNELNNQARLAKQELNKYNQTLRNAIRLLVNLGKTN